METRIGTIGNTYGDLKVKEVDGRYYWGIDNYDGIRWEEIPHDLYIRLLHFETHRQKE